MPSPLLSNSSSWGQGHPRIRRADLISFVPMAVLKQRCFQSLRYFLKITQELLWRKGCKTCSQQWGQSFPRRALPSQAPCALVASTAHSAVCTDCCCGGIQKGVAVEDSSAVVKVPGPAFFITAHAPGCRVVGEGRARDRASICVLPPGLSPSFTSISCTVDE